jgi:hypothetical protein
MIIEECPSRRVFPRWLLPAFIALILTGCSEPGVTPTTVRRPIPVSELPEPILKAAKNELRGVDFKEAWKNLDHGKTLLSYEIRGRNARGKICEVRVSTTGEILESE